MSALDLLQNLSSKIPNDKVISDGKYFKSQLELNHQHFLLKNKEEAKLRLLDQLEKQRPKEFEYPFYENKLSSIKNKAYVYFLIHKETKAFYFGSRRANKETAELDIIEYKSSSEIINPIFEEFNWFIIAEFQTGQDAYLFESQKIKQFIKNPLCLNKHSNFPNLF